jgi:cysteine desulfurase
VAITYLDHAATTPMRPAAVEAMLPFFSERFANPSGSHRFARDARRAVDEARDQVAAVLGVAPGEVVFTGCGTEADNTAILGTGGLALCGAAEHHAVLHPTEQGGGIVVGSDATGQIDLDRLADALTPEVTIVSVMAVNNEVGTISDLAAVSRLVRSAAPGALLHTDAVQAVCWLDIRTIAPLVDLMSFSAHKFGGPKGVGVLTIRDGIELAPLISGGGQERDRRSGTHNVAGIVALTSALIEADRTRTGENIRLAVLRDRLIDGLSSSVEGVVETVPRDRKVAGSAHVCLEAIESESLLFLLDEADVCASAASACASGAMEPSHVLAAMGVDRSLATGALRMTLGHTTTADDVDRAIDVVGSSVRRLRKVAVSRP